VSEEMRAAVMQADRNVAASFYEKHLARPGEVPVAAAMRAGHVDDSPLIQAFARHRLSAPPVPQPDREALLQAYAAGVKDGDEGVWEPDAIIATLSPLSQTQEAGHGG
jgi:hypothetical protein